MPKNTQLDNLKLDNFNLPYDLSKIELSTKPRLVEGSKNTLITLDGALVSRPPLGNFGVQSINKIDRLWYYETLTPLTTTGFIGQYVIFSAESGGVWNLYYGQLGLDYTTTTTTAIPFPEVAEYGHLLASTLPHEILVVRGKVYIKSFPNSLNLDRLGMFSFEIKEDGTAETNYWGLMGPKIPARLYDAGGRYSVAEISDSATEIVVNQSGAVGYLAGSNYNISAYSVPFIAYIEQEQVLVTTVILNSPAIGYDKYTIVRGQGGTTAKSHIGGSLVWATTWVKSAHGVNAATGWKYSYCWKNKNGHYSNRAKLETNLESVPSVTGPTNGTIPKILVTCPENVDEYPSILILRTTDGGGTFFPLTEIDNPGTPTVVFEDKYFPTGAVAGAQGITYDGPIYSRVAGVEFKDPVDDEYLRGDFSGPGLLTNTPLPTVVPPKVVGTDFPEPSTSLAYWKNRIWVAVKNILYFTSNEELPYGIPEEGTDTSNSGNNFRFQENISQIFATVDYLLVFTRKGRVLRMSGNTRDTFVPEAWLENVGYLANHPQAICKADDKIYFVGNNYQVYMVDDTSHRIVSHPLGNTIRDAILEGAQVQLYPYSDERHNWLVLGLLNKGNPEKSKILIYDLYKSQRLTRNYADNLEREAQDLPEKLYDFWNSPWEIPATAMIACPYNDNKGNTKHGLVFAIYSKTTNVSSLVMLDTFTDIADWEYSKPTDVLSQPFDCTAVTGLFENPVGYHVNTQRLGGLTPSMWGIRLERVQYDSDIDPTIKVFKNSLWQDAKPYEIFPNQFVTDSKGYRILISPVNEMGKYFAVMLETTRIRRPINFQKLVLSFEPEAGV